MNNNKSWGNGMKMEKQVKIKEYYLYYEIIHI